MMISPVRLNKQLRDAKLKMALVCRLARRIPEIREMHPGVTDKELAWGISIRLEKWAGHGIDAELVKKYFGRKAKLDEIIAAAEATCRIVVDLPNNKVSEFDLQEYLYGLLPKIWEKIVEIRNVIRQKDAVKVARDGDSALSMSLEEKIMRRNDLFELSNKIKPKFGKWFDGANDVDLGLRTLATIYDWLESYEPSEIQWVCGWKSYVKRGESLLINWRDGLEEVLEEAVTEPLGNFKLSKCLDKKVLEIYKDVEIGIDEVAKREGIPKDLVLYEAHERAANLIRESLCENN